jgi:hypothetical protein
MDCPFVPFHIKASIVRHVELQNVAWALMDQSQDQEPKKIIVLEQIVRHGVERSIGTTKLIDSSIYSIQEQNTKGVFTSTFCTIKDTNG